MKPIGFKSTAASLKKKKKKGQSKAPVVKGKTSSTLDQVLNI